MSERLLFTCTHGSDDPERATVPYIAASTAAASGKQAVVVCTADGVYTGVRGVEIAKDGMAPLADLRAQLVTGGGQVWLCSACTRLRDIADGDLVDGARIVGAAEIVEAVAEGAASVSLT